MNILEVKRKYNSQIKSRELDLLLEFILKKSKEFIFINPTYELSFPQKLKLLYFIKQLKNNKPLSYITKQKEFYGLEFKVNKHTLIPRPETEQIIDLSSEIIINHSNKLFTVIDIGTGSGNIIISLAKHLHNSLFYASDISKNALKIAKLNAEYHQVNVKFIQGNLLQPFQKILTTDLAPPIISGCCSNLSAKCNKLSSQEIKNKFLLITANLPYLSNKIYTASAKNVQAYEPQSALLSGKDGLDHYRLLLQQLKNIKQRKKLSFQKTYLILEISPEQKEVIKREILKIFPEAKIEIYKDLAQKWRMVKIEIET